MKISRFVPLFALIVLLLPLATGHGDSPPAPPVFVKMNADGYLYLSNPDSVLIVIGTDSHWFSADYLNMDGNKIINLAAPVEDGDAVNKYYADNLAASGGSTDSMKVDTGDGTRYNNVTKTLVLTEGVAIDIVANDDTTAYYLLSINIDTSFLNANWEIATADQATKDGSSNTITSYYSPTTHNHDLTYCPIDPDSVDVMTAGVVEAIFDRVISMLTSNTETGITVTGQDADNTIDFEVDVKVSDSAFALGDFDGTSVDTNAAGQLRIPDGGIGTVQLTNGSILFEDWGQNSAATGQIPKWSGTAWAAAADASDAVWATSTNGDSVYYIDGADTCWIVNIGGGIFQFGKAGLATVDSIEIGDFIRFVDTDTILVNYALLDSMINQKGVYNPGEDNILADTGAFNETEGFGLAGGKTGVALKVKGLLEGSNITITKSGDSALQITGAAGGSGSEDSLVIRASSADYSILSNALRLYFRYGLLAVAADSGSVVDTISVSADTSGLNSTWKIATASLADDVDTSGTKVAAALSERLIDNLVSLFKYYDRTYFDTLVDASGDSIICVYADSTDIAKFDSDDLAEGSSNLYNQTHTGDVTGSVALDIASGVVGTAEIGNSSILFEDWGQNSATTGQRPTWSGAAWVAQTPSAAGETNTLVDTGTFDITSGFGLATTKVGSELRIKGLIEGSNISMTVSGDTGIIITGAAGGSFAWTDSIGFVVGWGGVRRGEVNDTIYLSFEGSAEFDTTGGTVSLADDAVNSSEIDWGSGADQIDADDVPESSTRKFCLPADTAEWNLAYGWGDHSTQNYLDDDEADDVDDADIDWGAGAGQVNADDVPESATRIWPSATQETNWDAAWTWGDHSGLYISDADDAVKESHIDWGAGASQVSATDLPDFGTMTATDDNILVADGVDFESVAMSGDATMNNGVVAISAAVLVDADMANNALDPDKIVGDGTDDNRLDSNVCAPIVHKAERDASGNVITTTYLTSPVADDDVPNDITIDEASDVDTSGTKIAAALITRLLNAGDTCGWMYFNDTTVFGNKDIRIYPWAGSGQMLFGNGALLILGGTSGIALGTDGYLGFIDDEVKFESLVGDGLVGVETDAAYTFHTLTVLIDSNTLEFDNDTLQVDTEIVATRGYVDAQDDSSLNENPTVIGDLTVVGRMNESNISHALNFQSHHGSSSTSMPWGLRADTFLFISIPEDYIDEPNDSDRYVATHPSHLYFENGYRGYKYYLLTTPLDVVAHENPCLYVSNDSINYHEYIDSFHTGTLDTLHNPVFDKDTVSASHLSDGDLFVCDDGSIGLLFRASYYDPAPDSQVLWVSSSANLLTWSEPRQILSRIDGGDLISPSIQLDTMGSYRLWVVERDTVTPTDTSSVLLYEAPQYDSGWAFVDTTDMIPGLSGCKIWHLKVKRWKGSSYIAIIKESAAAGAGGGITISASSDGGITWTEPPSISIISTGITNSWDDQYLYRGDGHLIDRGDYWDLLLYYGAFGGPNSGGDDRHHIGLTTIHFNDSTNYLRIADTNTYARKVMVRDSAMAYWQQVRLEFRPLGQIDADADSCYLSFPYWEQGDDTTWWEWRDSSTTVDDVRDTVPMVVSIPYFFDADSIVYWYKSSGAANAYITEFDIYCIPDSLWSDSDRISYGITAGQIPPRACSLTTLGSTTDRNSTTTAFVAEPCDINIPAGGEVRINFINYFDADDKFVKLYKAFLIGKWKRYKFTL